jgi:anti-sigma factor RsiW
MIGHLGARVSALLDGQLPPAEAEEAWRHVYGCNACRDLVEREGWIKSRLAGLADGGGCGLPASHALKGSLLNLTPGESYLVPRRERMSHRTAFGVAVFGGGAVGAAVLGIVALVVAPSTGIGDQRPPASQIGHVTPSSPAPLVPVSRRLH